MGMRHWRQKYIKGADFLVRKRMTIFGVSYAPGDRLPKDVQARIAKKLRIWWNAKVIELAPEFCPDAIRQKHKAEGKASDRLKALEAACVETGKVASAAMEVAETAEMALDDALPADVAAAAKVYEAAAQALDDAVGPARAAADALEAHLNPEAAAAAEAQVAREALEALAEEHRLRAVQLKEAARLAGAAAFEAMEATDLALKVLGDADNESRAPAEAIADAAVEALDALALIARNADEILFAHMERREPMLVEAGTPEAEEAVHDVYDAAAPLHVGADDDDDDDDDSKETEPDRVATGSDDKEPAEAEAEAATDEEGKTALDTPEGQAAAVDAISKNKAAIDEAVATDDETAKAAHGADAKKKTAKKKAAKKKR